MTHAISSLINLSAFVFNADNGLDSIVYCTIDSEEQKQ